MRKLILLLAIACYAQSFSPLFQQAQLKENGEGDLKAAVAIYEKIVGDAAAERGLRAKALLHIGICWEKMGKQEAMLTYQKLAREFADQTVVVAEARERLSALTSQNNKAKEKGLIVRKINLEGAAIGVYSALSPDGRYLSYVDQATGNLAILEMASGEKKNVTNLKNANWDQYAEFSKWSPDSRNLFYTWYTEAGQFELRTIAIDGSAMCVTYPGTDDIFWTQPVAWSSSNQFLLALISFKGGKTSLIQINLPDLQKKEIKTFQYANDWPNVLLSQDNKTVYYDYKESANSLNHDIFELDIETLVEKPFIAFSGEDILLSLSPDNKKILFLSDRSGTLDIWAAALTNNRINGLNVIRSDVGIIFPMGMSQNGTFLYTVITGTTNLYIAAIDLTNGRVLKTLEKLKPNSIGDYNEAEWSPDGKYLACITERGLRMFSNPSFLIIRSLETDKEQEFFHADYPSLMTPRWKDGESLYLDGLSSTTGLRATASYELGQNELKIVKKLAEPPYDSNLMGHVNMPDGGSLLYWYREPKEKIFKFIAYNLTDRKEKKIYKNIWSYNIQVHGNALAYSPDGQWFAYSLRNNKENATSLFIIPVEDGEPRELVHDRKGMILQLNWTPDSQHILANFLGKDGGLHIIHLDGGNTTKVDLDIPRTRSLRLHPDGKQIIYSGGNRKYEVWSMENYLPDAK